MVLRSLGRCDMVIPTSVTGRELSVAAGIRLPYTRYQEVVDLAKQRGERLNAVLNDLIARGLETKPEQCDPQQGDKARA